MFHNIEFNASSVSDKTVFRLRTEERKQERVRLSIIWPESSLENRNMADGEIIGD
jgi:hypothetical protein